MKKDKSKIILIGGGGHCKSCIDVIEREGRFEIAGIIEVKEKSRERILGYSVIGDDEDMEALASRYGNMLVTVGQMKTADRRIMLYEKAKSSGACLPVIVSPAARVSRHAELNDGTIVMENAVVHAGAEVGQNCIINTSAIVEHDARVGDHCHVSTGCIVNGGCRIGRKVFLGSGSIVLNDVEICDGAVIGAGAVITKDICQAGTYVGIPARALCKEVYS